MNYDRLQNKIQSICPAVAQWSCGGGGRVVPWKQDGGASFKNIPFRSDQYCATYYLSTRDISLGTSCVCITVVANLEMIDLQVATMHSWENGNEIIVDSFKKYLATGAEVTYK